MFPEINLPQSSLSAAMAERAVVVTLTPFEKIGFETTNHAYRVTFSETPSRIFKGGAGCSLFEGTATSIRDHKRLDVIIKKTDYQGLGYSDLVRELEVLRDCCKEPENKHLPLYIGHWQDIERSSDSYVVTLQGPGDLARHFGKPKDSKVGCTPQDPRFVLQVTVELLNALEKLHGKTWVHCDVQPKNILINNPPGGHNLEVTLIDFGACLKVGEAGRPRCWEYSAPEQWEGGPVDARTDAFGAAGVMLYLLTGRAPFPCASEEECRRQAMNVSEHFDTMAPRAFQDVSASMTSDLYHNSFTDDKGTLRGIRHVLWMALRPGPERIDAATMKRWLVSILQSS